MMIVLYVGQVLRKTLLSTTKRRRNGRTQALDTSSDEDEMIIFEGDLQQ